MFTDLKNWPFLLNLIEICQTLAGTEKDVKKNPVIQSVTIKTV